MKIPKKVAERMIAGLKQMRPVIEQQIARDVSEADTVTLVKDLLSRIYGYDKYAELTSEHAIRGTYCDIIVQLGEKQTVIIEVKAIGHELDDKNVKQAVDYAANKGVEWVVLTNARHWRLYKVLFAKPIDKHLVACVDLISPKLDIDGAFLFTKEAYQRGTPAEIHDRQMALNRYTVTALLVHNERVISTLCRELKRTASVNVTSDEVLRLLRDEVIKRDALDGKEAEDAAKLVNRREDRKLRHRASKDGHEITEPPEREAPAVASQNECLRSESRHVVPRW